MKSSVKSSRRSKESQNLDTQRHFAMDLDGNLEKISNMRSIGIVSEFPIETGGDCVLRLDMVRASSAACCRRVFMAETVI